MWLKRVDHMMIFVLIAGTYTPFCLIPLRQSIGRPMLVVIWSIAGLGIFLKIVWLSAPRWLYTAQYIVMGWVVVFAMGPLLENLRPGGFVFLVLGGVIYTLGGLIYAIKWPRIKGKWFGFHEVFHLFVLAGSFCHFITIALYL